MQVTNTETVRKELPEGWRLVQCPPCLDEFMRRDKSWVVCCPNDDGVPGWQWFRAVRGQVSIRHDKGPDLFRTALAAMSALDREYPLGEQEHGEK